MSLIVDAIYYTPPHCVYLWWSTFQVAGWFEKIHLGNVQTHEHLFEHSQDLIIFEHVYYKIEF